MRAVNFPHIKNMELPRGSAMRVKKKTEIPEGKGVFTNPSGMEIPRGLGGGD